MKVYESKFLDIFAITFFKIRFSVIKLYLSIILKFGRFALLKNTKKEDITFMNGNIYVRYTSSNRIEDIMKGSYCFTKHHLKLCLKSCRFWIKLPLSLSGKMFLFFTKGHTNYIPFWYKYSQAKRNIQNIKRIHTRQNLVWRLDICKTDSLKSLLINRHYTTTSKWWWDFKKYFHTFLIFWSFT